MSTDTTTWPTPIRLPGQAAAHPGPVDMNAMYVFHHAFRRDLERLTEAVRRTPLEDRETWGLLAQRWEVFSEQLHHHHEGEDLFVWPWLREHVDPEDLATLDAMEAEHADIDPLLASCAAGFAQTARRADEDARSALVVRLTATRDHLDRHLTHEETDAIRIIQRVMTAEDWAGIDDQLKKNGSLRLILTMVPWAGDSLPPHVQETVLATAGLPFRLVFLATRRRWARREQRTFRYLQSA